jgi:hypothetical protein
VQCGARSPVSFISMCRRFAMQLNPRGPAMFGVGPTEPCGARFNVSGAPDWLGREVVEFLPD